MSEQTKRRDPERERGVFCCRTPKPPRPAPGAHSKPAPRTHPCGSKQPAASLAPLVMTVVVCAQRQICKPKRPPGCDASARKAERFPHARASRHHAGRNLNG